MEEETNGGGIPPGTIASGEPCYGGAARRHTALGPARNETVSDSVAIDIGAHFLDPCSNLWEATFPQCSPTPLSPGALGCQLSTHLEQAPN